MVDLKSTSVFNLDTLKGYHSLTLDKRIDEIYYDTDWKLDSTGLSILILSKIYSGYKLYFINKSLKCIELNPPLSISDGEIETPFDQVLRLKFGEPKFYEVKSSKENYKDYYSFDDEDDSFSTAIWKANLITLTCIKHYYSYEDLDNKYLIHSCYSKLKIAYNNFQDEYSELCELNKKDSIAKIESKKIKAKENILKRN